MAITSNGMMALCMMAATMLQQRIYLCDDGKDPAKKEYIASLGDAAV
jgi:hypothetical protein